MEQFNDLIRELTDNKFNGKQGTYKTKDKDKEEERGLESILEMRV